MRKKIKIGILLFLCMLAGCLFVVSAHYQNTSAKRPENKYQKEIVSYKSTIDMDHDGVDDQTDILQNALDYVAARPKYKSKYYHSGYSDDEYGVCTDVVANAMKYAGYDLQKLVQEDIVKNPSDYGIDQPDPNIDFRRVKNLTIFFQHTAKSLSTNIYDLEEWQGGDIVIFQKHIGIVSDRRNENGVTYIIHHRNPFQKFYEENYLEGREDIVGHYRWNG